MTFSPEVDLCRGEFSRTVVDLGAFLKTGVGVGVLDVGTTDAQTAKNLDREYVTCQTHPDRTVVTFEIGESAVVKSEENPTCYTIYVKDCRDIKPIEKFMVKSIGDFKEKQ